MKSDTETGPVLFALVLSQRFFSEGPCSDVLGVLAQCVFGDGSRSARNAHMPFRVPWLLAFM